MLLKKHGVEENEVSTNTEPKSQVKSSSGDTTKIQTKENADDCLEPPERIAPPKDTE